MTSTIAYAGPPTAPFDPLGLQSSRMNPADVAAARRLIVKHVPVEDEIELRRMLGIHHD